MKLWLRNGKYSCIIVTINNKKLVEDVDIVN